jgi:hypothetical protein
MREYGYFAFQNPPYRASRQLLITRIVATGTSFSPLPCQAWQGHMVISAHRVKMEVGADGPASALPSAAAACGRPRQPAGRDLRIHQLRPTLGRQNGSSGHRLRELPPRHGTL